MITVGGRVDEVEIRYTTMAVGANAEELGCGNVYDTIEESLAEAKRDWPFLIRDWPDLDRVDIWTVDGYERVDVIDSYVGPKAK